MNAALLSLLPLIAACCILIVLSMLFSISESSFLAMNKLRLRVLRKRKDKHAVRTGKLLDQREILINSLLVANDFVNIMLSALLTAVFLRLFGKKGVEIAALTVTVLLLIFGEITPKTLAARNPDAIAYALSFFAAAVVAVLRPAVTLFTAAANAVLKLRGINVRQTRQSYTEEDIKQFIDAGWETGVLESDEKTMMTRAFKFTDLEAQSIMIPRTQIAALPSDASFRAVLELAERTRLSYFPVYEGTIDRIVGVLYLKDMIRFSDGTPFSMKAAVRPPLFILGSKKISSVQQLLREENQSAVIVTDEYAGTYGFLTKDGIYRAIFGSSGSECRTAEPVQPPLERADFYADGSTLLSDLKEAFSISLRARNSETLGGWIMEQLGRIPEKGDTVLSDGILFTVADMYRRRITQVRIRRPPGGAE